MTDAESTKPDADTVDDVEAEAPDAEEAATEDPPNGRRELTLSTPLAIGLAVLLVAALAAAIVFGWLLLSRSDDQGAREEALATARSYAVTVTSYDYQELDENFADGLDGATGEWRDKYSGASEKLKALITKAKATATGEVVAAGVKSASEDRAEVLLFVDQEVTNAVAKKPQVDRNRILMSLEKHDDRWLVSSLKLL